MTNNAYFSLHKQPFCSFPWRFLPPESFLCKNMSSCQLDYFLERQQWMEDNVSLQCNKFGSVPNHIRHFCFLLVSEVCLKRPTLAFITENSSFSQQQKSSNDIGFDCFKVPCLCFHWKIFEHAMLLGCATSLPVTLETLRRVTDFEKPEDRLSH